jgi:hypothetical protein
MFTAKPFSRPVLFLPGDYFRRFHWGNALRFPLSAPISAGKP